jgi:hypothetical protein
MPHFASVTIKLLVQSRPACSLGLSSTSQQYFSLRTNPATSRNQPAVLFSQNKPAPAISHQPPANRGDDVNFIFYDYWYSSL